MNKVVLIGRMVANPEARTLQSGTTVCGFTVAVDRKFKKDGQPTADFLNCVAFGKRAELVSKWFTKGKRIVVEGCLQTRSWDDKEGKKRYATEVIVDNVEFCGDKPQEGLITNTGTSVSSTPDTSDTLAPSEYASDDDLPFQ